MSEGKGREKDIETETKNEERQGEKEGERSFRGGTVTASQVAQW